MADLPRRGGAGNSAVSPAHKQLFRQDREPALVLDDCGGRRYFRPDLVDRLLQTIADALVTCGDRLENVTLRVDDETAGGQVLRRGGRRNGRGLRGGRLGQDAEVSFGERVPLLAGVLRAAGAVLVQPPDVRL